MSESSEVSDAVAYVQYVQPVAMLNRYRTVVSRSLASSSSSDQVPGENKVTFDQSNETVVCVLRPHPVYAQSYMFARLFTCPNRHVRDMSEYPQSVIDDENNRQFGESDLPTWVVPLAPKMPVWQYENLARREELRAALRADPPKPHESTIGYLRELFIRILKSARHINPRERLLVQVLLEECDNTFVTNREQANLRMQSLGIGSWLIRQSSIASNALIKVNVITFNSPSMGILHTLLAKVAGVGYIIFSPGVDDKIDYSNIFRQTGMPDIGTSTYVTVQNEHAFPSLLDAVEYLASTNNFRLDLFVSS